MVCIEIDRRQIQNAELLSFSEDSLGKPIADFLLEERERPQWIFEQDLQRSWQVSLCLSQRERNCLRAAGVTKVSDLLPKTREDLLEIKGIGKYYAGRIERSVGLFLNWLRITPELRLLGYAFGFNPKEEQIFLSLERETELKEDVIEVLSRIEKDEALILILRFGLRDWKQRSLGKVGAELGISRRQAAPGSKKASDRVRHPLWSRKILKHRRLCDYLPSND